MSEHSILSASKSRRWSRCVGSIEAERDIPDSTNIYADEGKLAHALAERMYFRQDYTDLNVNGEMVKYVQSYIDYINNLVPATWETVTYIERRVTYFPDMDPPQAGTADAVVIGYDQCNELMSLDIVDLKYGFKREDATNNTQLILYAIGVLEDMKKIAVDMIPLKPGFNINLDLDKVTLHIVQPRINNISTFQLTLSELEYWRGYLKAKGEIALTPGAPRIASEEGCRYCKAFSTCYAPYDYLSTVTQKLIMTDEDMKDVLDNAKLITSLLGTVVERVTGQIMDGEEFNGYKLVEGKRVRKLNDDAEEKLVAILGNNAYSKSILGLKDLEKLIDRETLNSLVHITQTKPLLVKEEDRREALDFEDLEYEVLE